MEPKLKIGQRVTLTGNLRCKKCNAVIIAGVSGYVGGFDNGLPVFYLDIPETCAECGTVNEACWQPIDSKPIADAAA